MSENLPQILILQPEDALIEHWTRILSAGDHLEVLVARNPEDVFSALGAREARVAAFLLPWPGPEFDPSDFFMALRSANLPQSPCVMALSREWTGEIAARASRIGVHSFLNVPLKLEEVITELIAIRKVGSSPSAARLFGEEGGVDPTWRKRMLWLASNIKREGVSAWERRVRKMLVRLDRACNGEIPSQTAEMLLLFAQRDHRQLDMMLGDLEYELTFDDLKRLYTIAESIAGKGTAIAGNEVRLVRLLEGVVAFIQRRSQQRQFSERFNRLRELASIFLSQTRHVPDGSEPPERKSFRLQLAETLEMDPDFLGFLEPERVKRIAAQIIRSSQEQKALDLARLTILAFILKYKDNPEAAQAAAEAMGTRARSAAEGDAAQHGITGLEHLKALSDVLGGRTQSEMEIAQRLQGLGMEIARENPGLSETPDLEVFQDLFDEYRRRGGAAGEEGTGEEGVVDEAGLDSRAISRGLTALKVAEAQAAEGAFDAPAPDAPSKRASSLLGRLADELGLPESALSVYDAPDLLDRLPEVDLDIDLGAGAQARVRLTALLIGEAQDEASADQLIEAFARRHREEKGMLAAMLQTLSRSGWTEAATRFKAHLSAR
ncbi:hypothetical protein KJ940_17435 [Myxococcota bacterium]|nr:hypothetical protein [Myxococcota bacterium]